MSAAIVVRETPANEKVSFNPETPALIKFPSAFEVVPPLQHRLYSLYELARQKAN